MEKILHTKFKKQNGKLVSVRTSENIRFKDFIEQLPDGQIVECFMNSYDSDGSYSQLSMIHACIRKIATEIGYDFSDMKLLIKAMCGMVTGDTIKSFADCSKEELNLVIQEITKFAEQRNIIL